MLEAPAARWQGEAWYCWSPWTLLSWGHCTGNGFLAPRPGQCKVTSSRSQAAAAAFCPLVSIETWVARRWWVWRGRGGDTSKNCSYSAGKCGTGHPTMCQTLLRIVHTLISLLVSSLNSPSSLLSGLPSGPLGWQHWINIWLHSPPNCNFKIGSQYLDNERSTEQTNAGRHRIKCPYTEM